MIGWFGASALLISAKLTALAAALIQSPFVKAHRLIFTRPSGPNVAIARGRLLRLGSDIEVVQGASVVVVLRSP